jgi:hypothetical protein
VAEYGGALYDAVHDHVSVLLDSEELAVLDVVRAALSEQPGVYVNPFHASSVRAHRIGSNARPTGLEPETIQAALLSSGVAERVRVVAAASQTDFVPVRIDKALGLKALVAELGHEGFSAERPLALAVGDTVEDLPMLRLAELPAAPANAEPELQRGLEEISGWVSGQLCQAGLLDAVRRLLAHDPRECSTCKIRAPLDPDDELLLTILGALDGGRRRKLTQAARLAAQLRGSRSSR